MCTYFLSFYLCFRCFTSFSQSLVTVYFIVCSDKKLKLKNLSKYVSFLLFCPYCHCHKPCRVRIIFELYFLNTNHCGFLKGPKLENFGSKFLKSPKPIWVVHFRRRIRNNYLTLTLKSIFGKNCIKGIV